MNWVDFESIDQINEINELSKTEGPVFIFKHSTRCAISSMALRRMQSANSEEQLNNATVYYLNLIKDREVSNMVSERYGINHESPQLLVIQNGVCKTSTSHNGVSKEILLEHI
jgi:bacillithiol system protein YtxJ